MYYNSFHEFFSIPFLFGHNQKIIKQQKIVGLFADFTPKGQLGLSIFFPINSCDVTTFD